jgi:hypothetical protein
MLKRSLFAISAVLAFCPACGSQSPDCTALLNNYANSAHASLLCDPTAANPCGDTAPVVVYFDNGSTTILESVAGNCTHSTASGKGPALNSLFNEYKSAGCVVKDLPFCEALQTVCLTRSGVSSCAP